MKPPRWFRGLWGPGMEARSSARAWENSHGTWFKRAVGWILRALPSPEQLPCACHHFWLGLLALYQHSTNSDWIFTAARSSVRSQKKWWLWCSSCQQEAIFLWCAKSVTPVRRAIKGMGARSRREAGQGSFFPAQSWGGAPCGALRRGWGASGTWEAGSRLDPSPGPLLAHQAGLRRSAEAAANGPPELVSGEWSPQTPGGEHAHPQRILVLPIVEIWQK